MITKHRCSNGVRIVLENIPSVRSVTIGLWIGTGSRDETEENNGISHFIEHMLFKGTQDRNARDIAEAFDRVGGQVNAFTSKEYTCLYARVLDEHAEYALEILSDMLFNSTFDDEELAKEKQVVYEEIKMYEDTPDDRVHDLLSQVTYKQHPLGYPILGTEETLKSFDKMYLKQHMKEHYLPENIVVSIAGNVTEQIIGKIEGIFSTYQAEGSDIQGEKAVFHPGKIAKQKDTEQAHLCVGFNGYPLGNENMFPMSILNNILGGSMSSRLFQEVREERGLAYSIFSYHSAHRDSGLLTIYGGTGAEQMDELFSTIFKTLDDIKKKGFTQKELDNSKEQIKGNLMLSLESTSSRMNRNAKNELLLQKHRSLDDMTKMIEAVTLDDIQTVIEHLFAEDYSCSVISPNGALPKLN
ncbi:putative Zn-dependent peptidase [Pullulanibacillus pueri]|uniref:Peptidase M16 n=1 Tax=Pullulanibacillus pueri TaxID=1437324 RepID=A0A8J3EMB5_9BACL|nr:pitrilysin family protein [Pullulanibacillus pueri]MBM7682526.1 putative Zn-dependent peptidase [Pullulanibacillus pueri]GGH82049.1 peptidase M16 [Pullulanibacillus pueri]